jgi:hypothetical protein
MIDDPRRRALVQELRAALGDARVTSCLEVDDTDPRTARHVSGRSIGQPCCWVRPQDTRQCAEVVRLARAHAAAVCPVGQATTFWDGLRVDGAVALDVTSLTSPLSLDPVRRTAWAGAGCSVRTVDRAARAQGLCLAAYPDAGGDTPVGSLVAVGCTAGLGLGMILPIDQVTGATVVLGTGEIVRTGASHALGGPPFLRHGLPDLLGLLTAAEGRAAIVTEVGLSLRPAAFAVRGRGRRSLERGPDAETLLGLLSSARRAIDRGTLATYRIELSARAGDPAHGLEVMFECASLRGAADACDEAESLRAAVEPALGASLALEPESDLARGGALPEYDARFDVPPGEHRRRIEGGAFWGAEVAASWGDDLAHCLALLLSLYRELEGVSPYHRRLGIYPGAQGVSIGVQVLGRTEPEQVARVVDALEQTAQGLLAAGAIPYRTGNLWRSAVSARLRAVSGDVFTDPVEVAERCQSALDPDGVLPGSRAGKGETPTERIARVKAALLEGHGELVSMEQSDRLSLPLPGGRVVLDLAASGAPGAQIKGRQLSLLYRIEGTLGDSEGARAHLRAVADTFLRVESAPSAGAMNVRELDERLEAARRSGAAATIPVPAHLLADPSLLAGTADRVRREGLDGATGATLLDLPPCLDTDIRPEAPREPVAHVHTPIVEPCDACGAALYCPANAAPRPRPARPLRILRFQDPTAAALAGIHAVAAAWQRPVPSRALEVLTSLLAVREGVLGVPQAPLELSLKRSRTALLPRLRFVEYSPRSRRGLPPREERSPLRRRHLIELAEGLGAPEARGWIDALAPGQPEGMELSFGVDADLEGGPVLAQLYAHVEPSDRSAMVATLQNVLAWCGAQGSLAARAIALASGSEGATRSDVVLVSLSPGPRDPRRTKIYFARRLAEGDGSGLAPADPGPLRAFAHERGLAVLACDSGVLRWEKWDFPCGPHYQLCGGLAEAFASGLPEQERSRIVSLLDGRRFAPWPTWLSVGPDASTLYFVPR